MSLPATDIDYLCDAIAVRSGNVIAANQSYLFESRLQPIAELAGLKDVHSLVTELRDNPCNPLHDEVAEAMTINETSFFRNMHAFDGLRNVILPELIEKRESTKSLTIWSAGSSSGQEAYSVAMLLRTHFPQLARWRLRILATDVSEQMVQRTRAGIYSSFEVSRGLPRQMLLRYFDRIGPNWQIKPAIRSMLETRRLNLTDSWQSAIKHDVVLLRNVLIYFDRLPKEQVLKRVQQSLTPDGYLILGGSETLIQLNAPFTRITLGKTVSFRPTAI